MAKSKWCQGEGASGAPSDPWEAVLRDAAMLRRKYDNVRQAPLSSWSLVNRAALRFRRRSVLENPKDHRERWRRAMESVLIDLYRRSESRFRRGQRRDRETFRSRTPEEARAHERALRHLEIAQQRLADVDRRKAKLIALRHFEQLPWRWISKELGAPISTIRDEWKFTLAWLRTELHGCGVDLDETP